MPSSTAKNQRGLLAKAMHLLWRLVVTTVASCMRYRVTGLAAEAAFFAILSMPPLVFALTGAIGYVGEPFTSAQVEAMRQAVITLSSRPLTERPVSKLLVPHSDDVVQIGIFNPLPRPSEG